MKKSFSILILFPLIFFNTCGVWGYSCSWKTIDCHRSEVVCNEKESVLLDSKTPISTDHCLAIKDMNNGKFRNYEIDVDVLSLESNEGQNSGYLGIVFNYLDQQNYNFHFLPF